MTDKSDDRVGHLNSILARGGGGGGVGILTIQSALPGRGMLKFRVDRCINNSLS